MSNIVCYNINLNYLPWLLDEGQRVLEAQDLGHEEKATYLHKVPVSLPRLSRDAGQGRIRVFSIQRGDRPSHDVTIEEGRLCRPGVEEHDWNVVTETIQNSS